MAGHHVHDSVTAVTFAPVHVNINAQDKTVVHVATEVLAGFPYRGKDTFNMRAKQGCFLSGPSLKWNLYRKHEV